MSAYTMEWGRHKASRLQAGGGAFHASSHMWQVSDLTTRALRALLLPHARDEAAVVLRPFWQRWNADVQGALAGKIGSHGPHHRFGELGPRPHLQVNVWRVGVKGSGRNLRVPLLEPRTAGRLVVHAVARGERRIA